jgi:Protein of unknown function (DUF3326)
MTRPGIQIKTFEIEAPRHGADSYAIAHFRQFVEAKIPVNSIPVRFVVTKSDADVFHCEVGCVIFEESNGYDYSFYLNSRSIFDFVERRRESSREFNVALIVPTGIGIDIGGQAGDAGPVAQLLGRVCDNLILHPNVVNASDINEMPENSLYIEGSVLSRLLMGTIGLNKVRANRVLTVIEDHEDSAFVDNTVNAINAARATYSLTNDHIAVLWPSFTMEAAESASGSAVGHIRNLEHLINCLQYYKGDYDAVAIASIISYDAEAHLEYLVNAEHRVNPWGGAEAMLTHAVSHFLNIPSAHAPLCESEEIEQLEPGVVDPRIAAEVVSTAYINCLLKGLQRSPRIVTDPEQLNGADIITARDVDCIVIPDTCLGLPVLAALEQGIKVVAVRNHNLMENDITELPWAAGQFFRADRYAEAVGIVEALKSGIDPRALCRPFLRAEVDLFHTDAETGTIRVVDYYGEEAERLEFEAEVRDGAFDYEVEVSDAFYDHAQRKRERRELERQNGSAQNQMVT